jgi:hypothetical protein
MDTLDKQIIAVLLMVLAVLLMAMAPISFPSPRQTLIVMGIAFAIGGLASLIFMELTR